MICALGLLLAYMIGSVPFGLLIARGAIGIDVRRYGSGNIGATNVWRAAGAGWGLLTGTLDLAKGWAAVSIMDWMAPGCSAWWSVAAAVTAVVGHSWPVWLRLRGGKGVLTGCGAFLALAWVPVLAAVAVFGVVYGLSRYVSLGSVAAAVSLVGFVILIPGEWQSKQVIIAVSVTAAIIIIRHISNLRRLAAGKELRFAGRGKDK